MRSDEIHGGTDLDADIASWLTRTVAGNNREVRAIAGGGQRKTYFVKADAGGRCAESVLQISSGGGPYDGRDIVSLKREAALFDALRGSNAETVAPRLIAMHPAGRAILCERAPGSSDFEAVGDEQRKSAIVADFIAALARLHSVDAERVRDVGFTMPDGVQGAARSRLKVWSVLFGHVKRPAPLVRFALRWLEDNAPENSGPLVICHGDVGPGNFLFEENRITTLVDWELSHLGDFHDDLGMLALRAFQLGSMQNLKQSLALYARLSGRIVDSWKVRYYRAMNLVLGTVTSLVQLDQATSSAQGPIAMPLYLHLVPMLQLWLAEALLDLKGLSTQALAPMSADVDPEALDVALAMGGAAPSLAQLGQSGGLAGYGDLVRHLEAFARYGRPIREAELADLTRLLGTRPADVWAGRVALDQQLQRGQIDEEALLRFYWRWAKRQSALWPAWAARYESPLLTVSI